MKDLLDGLTVPLNRRSFAKKSLTVASSAAVAPNLLVDSPSALAATIGTLSAGDAAMLRFAAAAEILESDFWAQN